MAKKIPNFHLLFIPCLLLIPFKIINIYNNKQLCICIIPLASDKCENDILKRKSKSEQMYPKTIFIEKRISDVKLLLILLQ